MRKKRYAVLTALALLLVAWLLLAVPSGEILPARRESYLQTIPDNEYSFLLN